MLHTAILSYWHVHAEDYAREAFEHPETELVAVWDEFPDRGKRAAELLGVRFFPDLTDLFAQPDIDGVIITAPTNMHYDIILAAIQAKKHIFTENALAPTLQECNTILKAAANADIVLTVSLPRLNTGYTQAIQDILLQKQLGPLTYVRTRLSHD